MLDAAVPSPNTFPDEEPMALLKAGLWPNEAVEPNAGELPKAGGLPNTGVLPKPPVHKPWLSVSSLRPRLLRSEPWGGPGRLIPGVHGVQTRFPSSSNDFNEISEALEENTQSPPTLEPTLSCGLRRKRGGGEMMH